MKNVVVLCLLYASLVSAGFFTPSPEKHRPKDDVRIDKEKVVIGIEDDNGNTKVKISPHRDDDEKGVFASAKEKIKEASSNVVPEVMKKGGGEESHHKSKPGEVVCDAYGKCKEKISSYMGRTKEAAEKAAEKGYMVEEEAEEGVKGGVEKVKDKVAQATQKAYDKARGTKDRAEEEATGALKGRIGSVKDSVAQATQKAADKARESKERAEDAASEMKEGVKEKAKAAEGRLKEGVKEKAKAAEERLKTRGKEGLKSLPFSSVLHLLGFATAYGMCVWVTFGSSYVLAKALPRQQLAVVQSRLYPVYFKAMASSVGMALLGYLMDRRRKLLSPSGLGIFRGFDLLASLLMILANLLYLEPRATKVLFERMRKEKEEGGEEGGDAPPTGEAVDLGGGGMAEGEKAAGKVQNVRNILSRLNSYSSLLNVMTLVSLSWHLVHLGHHLHAAC